MTKPQTDHHDEGDLDAVYVLTREGSRSLDRAAVEEYGLPNIVLMENAAGAVEAEVIEALNGEDGFVLICCGPGNNGGDGLAAARRLHNAGVRVAVALCAPESSVKGDAAVHLKVAKKMEIPLEVVKGAKEMEAFVRELDEPSMIVDAIFGTGLDRALESGVREIVQWINGLEDSGVFVLAVDVPTGLDADTGKPIGGVAVRADVTVALAGVKKGFLTDAAGRFIGEVVVGDIGAPVELLERFGELLEE